MAATAPETVVESLKGFLTITIAEASGRNRDDEDVWDPAFVEGFVKGVLHWLRGACMPLTCRRHSVY